MITKYKCANCKHVFKFALSDEQDVICPVCRSKDVKLIKTKTKE